MTLKVESPGVYTSQGVPISVTGIAQVDKKILGVIYRFFFISLYGLMQVEIQLLNNSIETNNI